MRGCWLAGRNVSPPFRRNWCGTPAAPPAGVCTDEEASAVAGFLLHRKERIMSYLSGNQSLLPKVTNWETL